MKDRMKTGTGGQQENWDWRTEIKISMEDSRKLGMKDSRNTGNGGQVEN